MSTWPPTGTPVELRTGATTIPSRVVGTDGPALMIARPRRQTMTVGTPVAVQWEGSTGPITRDAVIDLVLPELGGWRLVPLAETPAIPQRRRFTRVTLLTQVQLLGQDVAIPARTLDLSEGGISVSVPSRTAEVGDTMTTVLALRGERWSLPSTVLRVDQHGDATVLGLAFTEVPLRCAEAIRRAVFSEQIRQRTRGVRR